MSSAQVTDRLNEDRDDDLPAIKSNTVKQALRRARAAGLCGMQGRGYVKS
jgi:hypothetical protein